VLDLYCKRLDYHYSLHSHLFAFFANKKQVDIRTFICYIRVAYVYNTKAKFVVVAVHIYAQKPFIQPLKFHYHIIHMHLSHQSPHITLFLQLMNTCELCTSVLNLDRLASCCISVLRQKQEPKELTLVHNFLQKNIIT
jgi:hypothetical protein